MYRKKIIKNIFVLIALFLLLCGTAKAQEGNEYTESELDSLYSEQYENSGTDELYTNLDGESAEIVNKLGIDPSDYDSVNKIDINSIFDIITNQITEHITTPFTVCLSTVTAVLAASIFVSTGPSSASFNDVSKYIISIIMIGIVIIPVFTAVKSAANAAMNTGNFMTAFVPVYAGILTCNGQISSATAYQSIVFFCAQAVSLLANSFMIPVNGMLLALSAAASISDFSGLRSTVNAIRRIGTYSLAVCMTVFTAAIAITGGINAVSDSVSMRTAKFFIGNFIPVVGGILSEALNSINGAVLLLKNTVGIFGIVAVCAILLPCIIELTLWKIMLMLTTSVCEIIGVEEPVSLFNNIGFAVGFMISVMICIGALFLISLAIILTNAGAS